MKKKKVIAQRVLSVALATALASNSSSFTGLSSITKAAESLIKNEEINELQENISTIVGDKSANDNNNNSISTDNDVMPLKEKINQEEPLDSPVDENINKKVEEKILTTNEETSEESPTIMYEGIDGDLSWSIDSNGLLTITGIGDWYYEDYSTIPQWCSYSANIKKAKVNISNITNARYMFKDCSNLTELDLINLNTSDITNMNGMFENCNNLTSLDLSGFNTSQVISMSNMFSDCRKLNTLDLSNFDTSNVENMNGMFENCNNLTSLDLSGFNTVNVTEMSNMFSGCEGLSTLDLNNFDTSNVKDMYGMFSGCRGLSTLDLSNFDTSNVVDMGRMFIFCIGLTALDLSNFNTSNVMKMENMFEDCNSLISLNLSNFDTSNIGSRWFGLEYMFSGCNNLISLDLSSFDTSNITLMYNMFEDCNSLTNLKLNSFDTSNVTRMENMFKGCSALTTLDLSNFDTSNVINMSDMFADCSNLSLLDLSNFNTSKVVRMGGLFYNCSGLKTINLSNFNTSNVTEMYSMFSGCTKLTALDLSSFNTDNVIDMYCMFENCSNLDTLDLSNFNNNNVTNMNEMFLGCSGLTAINLSNFGTNNVTNMDGMFLGCSGLTTIDLSSFNTSNTTNMSRIFYGCNGLTTLDLSNFNTSKVTDMYHMFSGCSGLTTINLSNFDTNNVTDMYCMFKNCSGLTTIDLSSFNTNNVTDMDDMFQDCSNLITLDLSNFNINNIASVDDMLYGCSGLTNLIAPANMKKTISLPSSSNYYWLNKNGERCTKIASDLATPMTYIKVITEDIKNFDFVTYHVTFKDELIYDSNIQERTFDLTIRVEEHKLIEGTDYTYTVTGNTGINAGNYKLLITVTGIGDYTGNFIIEKDWSIAKAPVAPNLPESILNVEIYDGLKVSDIPLGDYPNWKWIETDWQKELPTKVGETLKSTTEYIGEDASNYETITQPVTITMINKNDKPTGGDSDPTTGGAIGDDRPSGDNNPSDSDDKPNTGDNNPSDKNDRPSSGNNSSSSGNNNADNNGTGNGGISDNTGGSSTIITTPSVNAINTPTTSTQPEQGNTDNSGDNNIDNNTKINNPDTIIETKSDGTVVEKTTQTTENGSNITTITETKTDGSSIVTKTITTNDSDATLTIKKETNQQSINTSAVIGTGKQGNVIIPVKFLETIAKDESVKGYIVEISSSTITAGQKFIKNTVVTVNLPSTNGINAENIVLTQDSIQTAKETGKGLKIIVTTENSSSNTRNNNNYTVTIPSKQLSKIDNNVDTISIAMSVNTQNDKINNPDTNTGLKTALANSRSKAKKTCVISTAKNETLDNVGMKLQIDVTNVADVKVGNKVYIYKYNEKTGKLEELANSKQTVASDGIISIEGYSGTDYVVFTKKLTGKSVVTIKNGIHFNTKKNLMKQGKKLLTSLLLPNTVSTKNKFGTEKATIAYKSHNSKVASISQKGVITAKKAGKAIITAVIKLESGQKITKTKKITIK